MSTQEERRQAIGRANTAERQASGQRIRDDINRSLRPERKQKTLAGLPLRGGLPVQVGVGEWQGGGEVAGTGGGIGIASPLTEADASAREYWPDGLKSSDGLFVMPAIKSISMTDANGAAVQIQLADPGWST